MLHAELLFSAVGDRHCTVAEFIHLEGNEFIFKTTYFIATPPDRGWQRNEGLLLLHSFLSLDIFVAFSILRFGTSAKSVS